MNLVISTTQGWNIGDQFILAGVMALLRESWGDFQHVVHNRHPDLLPSGGSPSHEVIMHGWADALVVAGSPGWTGECSAIYRTALERGVPIYLIGIGSGAPSEYLAHEVEQDASVRTALEKARLVICRDEPVRDVVLMHRQESHLLPCPAIFLPHEGATRDSSTELTALGCWSPEPPPHHTLVAHQTSDLVKHGRAFYSNDPAEYVARYAGASRVVSSRLHASIICRALGVPVENLWPADDFRCATTWSVIEHAVANGLSESRAEYARLLSSTKPCSRN